LLVVPDDLGEEIGCCGGLGASSDGDGQPTLNMPNPGKVGHVGRSCTVPLVLGDVGVGSPVSCSDALVGSSCLLDNAVGDVGVACAAG
jgi:hypothetical protein